MRAFSLLCLCSLLGLSLAQQSNNPSAFADKGTVSFAYSKGSYTLNLPFTYTMDQTSYNSLLITNAGAAFPSATAATAPKSQPFNSVTTPVVGPLWTQGYVGGTIYYYTVQSGTTANNAFLTKWSNMIDSQNQFKATSAIVVTWWQMYGKASTANTCSFQLIILTDNNGVTYAQNLYGEILFSTAQFRAGFSNGVSGANAFSYESPFSNTPKIQSSGKGKLGQANFQYKLSVDPFVDSSLAVDASYQTSFPTSGQFIGLQFSPEFTSHGQTAFNFYTQNTKTSGAPLAFAVANSYMYCFTSMYTGIASQAALKAAPHHYAVSNQAALNVWEFSENHVFHAGTTYYCYCDTPTSYNLVLTNQPTSSSKGKTRSPGSSYLAPGSGNGNFAAASNNQNFAYQMATILFGAAKGDPIFRSLRTGDSFIFGGQAGEHFNLYHDRYVNLNAEFDFANPATQEGTIIKTVGIMVGGHKISFSTEDFAAGSIQVNLDGKSVKLFNDKVHLSGCVDIHYLTQWSSFYVVSPTHKFKFTIDEKHSEHMNNKFINIVVDDVPESAEDLASLGGVIGESMHAGPINTNAEDFHVSGLFAVEKSKYAAADFGDCI